jgi:hypothetical protein
MDELLSAPTSNVTITQNLDELQLHFRPVVTWRDQALDLINPPLVTVFAVGGGMLGVSPFAEMFHRAGLLWPVLSVLLALVGLVVGVMLGLVPAYLLSVGLTRLLGITSHAFVVIGEHSLTIGQREVAIAEVLSVDRSASELVTRDGRIPIAQSAPEATRSWLVAVLHEVTEARQEGTPEEVPQGLAALKQPT